MRGLEITIEDHKTGRLRLYILPTDGIAFGGRERTLQISRERVVRRRNAPLGQSVRRHGRQVALPGRVGRCPYFEIRETGCARESIQGDLAFLNAAFQIVHHEGGLVFIHVIHVLDVEPGLRARHFQTQVEPFGSRNINRSGEARPVIDLPVATSVEDRRVLQGVGKSGLVLAEINLFGVEAVVDDPKHDAEKAALRGGCDVHIDHRIAHFKVFQRRRSTIEEKALAALILSRLGLSFEIPTRGVGRDGERLRRLGFGRGREEKTKSTKSEMTSKHRHCDPLFC